MKKLLAIVVALMISPPFITGVLARDAGGPRVDTAPSTTSTPLMSAKKVPESKSRQYAGTIILVDKTAKGIVVKGRKGEMTFDVSSAKWKPYKSMNEVKLGDPVTVRYTEKDGEMMASSVTKANPSGVKEESSAGTEKKTGRSSASAPPKGGVKEESTPTTK